jgi:hypothetical protein
MNRSMNRWSQAQGINMDTEAPQLVLVMPRRELFRVHGFTRKVDMDILLSLAEDSWYAAPHTLVNNADAKEVRLGLVVIRNSDGEQFLVDENGVALHATLIPPEAGILGPGLAALKQLALLSGKKMLGVDQAQVELVGYCNDDSLPECRPYFLLVYCLRVSAQQPTPSGFNWISRSTIAGVPLDPVSALVLGHW